MATFTTAITDLRYAASSSWTSGKARQGVYSSTRYEGAITFGGLSSLKLSNIAISQIQLKLTFGPAGGESTKNLTFYKATSNTVSGSIASMRGASIGAISVSNAYNRTVTLTFNSSTNAGIFNTLRSYFLAGNRVLIIYVPTSRGSYGSFDYDYLQVNDGSMTLTYEYLQSDGFVATNPVAAGSTARLNITAYNSAYTHKVVWSFMGGHSATQTIPAGQTYASYTIPLSWLDGIPDATRGIASVTLETIDTNGNSLGTYGYLFDITVPASVVPTMTGVTATPVNSNSLLNSWGLYAYAKSQAKLTITGAAGAYGSTITSYSITTSPSIGSSTLSSFTTTTIYQTGTITVTARITDSRGRSATSTTTLYVYPYAAPYFTSVQAFRSGSFGQRDDVNGTYANVKTEYACYSLNGNNRVTGKVLLEQVGGSYSTSNNLVSGFGTVLGGGQLAPDATYLATLTLTDTLGTTTVYTVEVLSHSYIMHIKKGGKAVGFGVAAGEDETVTFGWPIILNKPLGVDQGGTGAASAGAALTALGAVAKAGDTMTGNLTIQNSLYPTLYLRPTYNNTTNRTVFEGSYIGASSFAAWEDSSGNNRRMLEVRTAAYQPSMDNAVVLRCAINGAFYSYRLFHAGMATPVPVANGGTGASTAKQALANLGITYSESLPWFGSDGQICLVPV